MADPKRWDRLEALWTSGGHMPLFLYVGDKPYRKDEALVNREVKQDMRGWGPASAKRMALMEKQRKEKGQAKSETQPPTSPSTVVETTPVKGKSKGQEQNQTQGGSSSSSSTWQPYTGNWWEAAPWPQSSWWNASGWTGNSNWWSSSASSWNAWHQ